MQNWAYLILSFLLGFVAEEYLLRLYGTPTKTKRDYLDSSAPFKTAIPMYYINLERSPERKSYMEQAFGESGKLIRVPGVDGTVEQELERVLGIESDAGFHDYMNKSRAERGELALTASHIRAVLTAYGSGSKYAMILEDDASPALAGFWDMSLDSTVALLDDAVPGWTMLRLQYTARRAGDVHRRVREWREHPTVRFIDGNNVGYGCVAYIISVDGMKEIEWRFTNSKGMIDPVTRRRNSKRPAVADILLPMELPRVVAIQPPMFTVRIFEGSTGVRGGGRKDLSKAHLQSIADSVEWNMEAFEVRRFGTENTLNLTKSEALSTTCRWYPTFEG